MIPRPRRGWCPTSQRSRGLFRRRHEDQCGCARTTRSDPVATKGRRNMKNGVRKRRKVSNREVVWSLEKTECLHLGAHQTECTTGTRLTSQSNTGAFIKYYCTTYSRFALSCVSPLRDKPVKSHHYSGLKCGALPYLAPPHRPPHYCFQRNIICMSRTKEIIGSCSTIERERREDGDGNLV